MLKGIMYCIIYILSIVLFIPISISFISSKIIINKNVDTIKNIQEQNQEVIQDLEIISQVENNLEEENKPYKTNKFEDYIVGVVAAEMPVSFEKEALKAQAVAARTYAYKRIDDVNKEVNFKEIGQAYNSIEEMKAKWGNNFEQNYNKVKTAVYETNGLIMTYQNEPIEAVFHSTSAGVTELSENIWGRNLPYIKSVDSKVDEKAPNFIYTTKVSNNEIIQKISDKFNDIDKTKIIETFEIKKRSEAGYVLEVSICGKIISGRDIRTMFNLRSTNFTIEKTKDSINFTTKGYGHGAGMSQYGANFMAQDGSTYEEILLHYYGGVSLQKVY